MENERNCNNQAAQPIVQTLALSTEQANKGKSVAQPAKSKKDNQPSKQQLESSSKINDIDEKMEEISLYVKRMGKFIKRGNRAERSDRTRRSDNHDKAEKKKTYQSNDESDDDQPEKKEYQPKTSFDKSKLLCFYCSKPGHFKADCPKLAKYGDAKKDQKYTREQKKPGGFDLP